MDAGTHTRATGSTGWIERDQARLGESLQLLEDESPAARELLTQLRADGTRIHVVPDAEYYADRPYTSGASYDYVENVIRIPRSRVHDDAVRAAVMLAHEAQHHADMPMWREGALRGRDGFSGAVDAVPELRSPVTGFQQAVRERRDGHEVSAYHLQARVASDLGRPELGGLGVDEKGAPKDETAVRQELTNSSLYRTDKRKAALAERTSDERPPSDPSGHYDGAASAFTVDGAFDPVAFAGPAWHAGWQGALAGGAFAGALVRLTPLRYALPAPVAVATVAAAAMGLGIADRLRHR